MQPRADSKHDANMKTRLSLGLILLGLVVIFTVQNTEVMTVRFLLWDVALSRALLIFIVLASGVIVGWVLNGLARRHHR